MSDSTLIVSYKLIVNHLSGYHVQHLDIHPSIHPPTPKLHVHTMHAPRPGFRIPLHMYVHRVKQALTTRSKDTLARHLAMKEISQIHRHGGFGRMVGALLSGRTAGIHYENLTCWAAGVLNRVTPDACLRGRQRACALREESQA